MPVYLFEPAVSRLKKAAKQFQIRNTGKIKELPV
jgi:hypothetical protein